MMKFYKQYGAGALIALSSFVCASQAVADAANPGVAGSNDFHWKESIAEIVKVWTTNIKKLKSGMGWEWSDETRPASARPGLAAESATQLAKAAMENLSPLDIAGEAPAWARAQISAGCALGAARARAVEAISADDIQAARTERAQIESDLSLSGGLVPRLVEALAVEARRVESLDPVKIEPGGEQSYQWNKSMARMERGVGRLLDEADFRKEAVRAAAELRCFESAGALRLAPSEGAEAGAK
jgi:hypothetical protein